MGEESAHGGQLSSICKVHTDCNLLLFLSFHSHVYAGMSEVASQCASRPCNSHDSGLDRDGDYIRVRNKKAKIHIPPSGMGSDAVYVTTFMAGVTSMQSRPHAGRCKNTACRHS